MILFDKTGKNAKFSVIKEKLGKHKICKPVGEKDLGSFRLVKTINKFEPTPYVQYLFFTSLTWPSI